jgi:glycosyltransferase involved in cell wall biosynthesis
MSEWLATKLANRIVADSAGIQAYYQEAYGVESTKIAYGAQVVRSKNPELLNALDLKPGSYFLQITRFEPENNPLLTIKSFKQIDTDKKLILVGGVPYESEYSRQIAAEASEQVLLLGFVYDKDLLNELWCNCYAYVHGNEVGGTNPALLQTMASGCFTLAIDVPFSHDVLRDGGIFYRNDVDDLSGKMCWALDHPSELQEFKSRAVRRIEQEYTWDKVTDGYEKLFRELIAGRY